MKTVIKHITRLLAILLVGLQLACSDFLEMPMISSVINIDTVFSTRLKAEPFLWETYRQSIPSGFPLFASNSAVPMHRSIRAAITDECDYAIGWASASEINDQGYSPKNDLRLSEISYAATYSAIRRCFLFIENIDKVSDISADEKNQMKMECKTLVALQYMLLVRSFAGVPLVTKLINANDDMGAIKRAPVESCINYIITLCDEAIASNLPDKYDTNWRGRVTKGVAHAIKARTLLYAASPLFNSSRPVISYGGDNDKLLCYGKQDKELWKKAADANKALLTWADAGNAALIKIQAGASYTSEDAYISYGQATSVEDNDEILLSNKTIGAGSNGGDGFTKFYLPAKDITAFNAGNSITFNALKYFYTADGKNQTWPEVDEKRAFSEYADKMHAMEPRFLAMAWVFGEKPKMCPNRYNWNYKVVAGDTRGGLNGVALLLKFAFDYQGENYKEFPVFRLAEFYLNYAEALNEYNGTPPQEAYDALNTIRSRAGLPEILKSDANYNTTEKFRELVRRERFIELFAEDQRIYDIRRWKIAHEDGVGGGNMYAIKLVQNNTTNPTAYTQYYPVWYEKRFWMNKMYYHPFPQVEVDKGNLLQNPGY